MKERPILFSAPMVRAILAGTKTQTRRLLSRQPHHALSLHIESDCCYAMWGGRGGDYALNCPYGTVGDQLWVRETFQSLCDVKRYQGHAVYDGRSRRIVYAADGGEKPFNGPWKPSIFMPRDASRITLEVTGVRGECLQNINETDALAEGIEKLDDRQSTVTTIGRYANLWDSLNAKRAPWASNPWVWVIEFKQVKP